MNQTITDTFISKLKAPKGKPVEYYDNRLSGFGVRIGKKGQIGFIIDYRLSEYNSQTGQRDLKRFRKAFAKWEKNSPDTSLKLLNASMARENAELFLAVQR